MLDTLNLCYAAYPCVGIILHAPRTKAYWYEQKNVIREKVRGIQGHLSVTLCQVIAMRCGKASCYTVNAVSIRMTRAQTRCSTYRLLIRSRRGKVTLWPRFRNGELSAVPIVKSPSFKRQPSRGTTWFTLASRGVRRLTEVPWWLYQGAKIKCPKCLLSPYCIVLIQSEPFCRLGLQS